MIASIITLAISLGILAADGALVFQNTFTAGEKSFCKLIAIPKGTVPDGGRVLFQIFTKEPMMKLGVRDVSCRDLAKCPLSGEKQGDQPVVFYYTTHLGWDVDCCWYSPGTPASPSYPIHFYVDVSAV